MQLNKIELNTKKECEDPEFRRSFMETTIEMYTSLQIEKIRGGLTQAEFAEKLGKPQSVIARLENPDTAKSIKSLLDIANGSGMGLVVKFVSFEEWLSTYKTYEI